MYSSGITRRSGGFSSDAPHFPLADFDMTGRGPQYDTAGSQADHQGTSLTVAGAAGYAVITVCRQPKLKVGKIFFLAAKKNLMPAFSRFLIENSTRILYERGRPSNVLLEHAVLPFVISHKKHVI
ncbi:hypothetical protein [Noviherbaspirillum malthae]|uniref:hypothetical protein n=1 Tax=Noviherbaspirillum malthae TaxID=1260987 RepID=UPI00188E4662|nr:hypothetical protein [Noviherbaspirillum malthae]